MFWTIEAYSLGQSLVRKGQQGTKHQAQLLEYWACTSMALCHTAMTVLGANTEQRRHMEGSRFEGGMTGTLQLSVDGAMVHQGGSRGLDDLSQPTGKAAGSMQPPLLCTTYGLPCVSKCGECGE